MPNRISPKTSEEQTFEGSVRDEYLFYGRYAHHEGHLYKYLQTTLELNILTMVASALGGLSVYLFSLLPWEKPDVDELVRQNEAFYNADSILVIWIMNFVFWGNVFIPGYLTILFGFRRVMESNILIYSTFGLAGYVAFYTIATKIFEFHWWFYYLEIFAFIGYAVFAYTASYLVSRDRKFAVKLTVSELTTLICFLLYVWILMPVYSNFASDFEKGLFRLIAHPIITEITMVLPARYMQRRYDNINDPITKTVPTLHAQLHTAIIGRCLLINMNTASGMLVTAVLVNFSQIVLRLTLPHRDRFVFRLLNGPIETDRVFSLESSKIIKAVNVITEQLIENSAILLTMSIMWFFQDFKVLFNFGGYRGYAMDIQLLMISVSFIFILEIFGDVTCFYLQSKWTPLPTLEVWKLLKEKHKSFLVFLVYSVWAMALLSIIYFSAKTPKLAFCTKDEMCSCSYPHIIKLCQS